MTDENVNRVVVVDDQGETREKTEEEIAKENATLEESLQAGGAAPTAEPPPAVAAPPAEEKKELDAGLLEKLRAKKQEMEKEDSMPITAVAKRDRSLYFGVVGLGQAGSRIAEIFYSLGYEACAMNTATQDLEHIKLPDNRKVLLPFALGGAGKELDNGRQAVREQTRTVFGPHNDRNKRSCLAR